VDVSTAVDDMKVMLLAWFNANLTEVCVCVLQLLGGEGGVNVGVYYCDAGESSY
jgi:hypothetical protein